MAEFTLDNRVTRLETQMAEVREDIADIKTQIQASATKADLAELKAYFERRDQTYTTNMWKVIFGLLAVLVALVALSFGLKEIPKLF